MACGAFAACGVGGTTHSIAARRPCSAKHACTCGTFAAHAVIRTGFAHAAAFDHAWPASLCTTSARGLANAFAALIAGGAEDMSAGGPLAAFGVWKAAKAAAAARIGIAQNAIA